jgi:hypothetical protein
MATIAANPKAGSVTLKNLAASLAAEHDLTKRAGREYLNDLIVLITKHLNGANVYALRILAFCRLKNVPLGSGAILRLASQSRSRQAGEFHSGQLRK